MSDDERVNSPASHYRTWEDFKRAWRVRTDFRRGFIEVLLGEPFRQDFIDRAGKSEAIHYELGRQWALVLRTSKSCGAWKIPGRPPAALRRMMYPAEAQP